jgi:hypothetical protein
VGRKPIDFTRRACSICHDVHTAPTGGKVPSLD